MPIRRKRMRKTLRTGRRARLSAEMIFLSDLPPAGERAQRPHRDLGGGSVLSSAEGED